MLMFLCYIPKQCLKNKILQNQDLKAYYTLLKSSISNHNQDVCNQHHQTHLNLFGYQHQQTRLHKL